MKLTKSWRLVVVAVAAVVMVVVVVVFVLVSLSIRTLSQSRGHTRNSICRRIRWSKVQDRVVVGAVSSGS